MRSLARQSVVGVAVTAFVFLAVGATTATAAKSKSTQTEATWISFDAENNTVKVKVKKPGVGAKPPKHLKLKKGKEAEFNVIPQKVQEDIRELFDFGKSWLSGVLEQGREHGEFAFDGAASERAVLIMSAVQGALQIARATGPKEFSTVTSQIRLALKPRK